MPIGERVKQLRKEKRLSQEVLAKAIGGDARQISRYENEKITPSAEGLIKLAEAFDVSIDYLLLEDAPRRPLRMKNNQLVERIQELEELPEEDRSSLFHILDALIARNKMKSLMQHMG